jgi:hypothetical protein
MTDETYNYERFDQYVESGREVVEFAAFPGHLHAGESAPDIAAVRLDDGSPVHMSEVWVDRTVVLEFGSFT